TYTNKTARGFLYKPVDFDSSKKYPVIIGYYENTMGNRGLELQGGASVPLGNFLQRGYLVFFPEVRHSLGEIATAAYDFVVSGAESIAQLPYVNSKRMGITGHSFGSYQTNFLVTQTNLFAAAVSNSGMSNLISDYGAINEFHRLPAASNEAGQTSIGATPWSRPDLYIKNSPIFYADKINTPLLLSHCQDPNVPLNNSIQLFMALRRLGRRVWLLTNNEKTHGGVQTMKKNNVNLVEQFFDHYLKDAPAPCWMLEGIPAKLRGVESRTESDSTGRTPGSGLVMENVKPFSEVHAAILNNPTEVTPDGKIEKIKQEVSTKITQPKQQPDETSF
ncbi:MAG: S9 family peptidase, partial [Chitinophagaceae bacterium]|nr:S9 family peptidase [Chitinophagaceae bacterium]